MSTPERKRRRRQQRRENEKVRQIEEQQEKRLNRHGWYHHLVVGDSSTPYGINVHTHGLDERFGHPNLQIVLPLPDFHHLNTRLYTRILNEVIAQVRSGVKFNAGQRIRGVCRFMWAVEDGRAVLRVILPDTRNRLNPDNMDRRYARQYEGTQLDEPHIQDV